MSQYYQENNMNNISTTLLNKDLKNAEPHKLSIITKNFVSLLFQEALYNIKNKEIEENKIVSKFISSIFNEIKIEIIVSNFVNSVFEVAKIKANYNNKIRDTEISNCSTSNKKIVNKRIPNLINKRKVINENKCEKHEINSTLKSRKVHFNIACDSNRSTFFKSNKDCEISNTKSPFKNKRNHYSSQDKDNKIINHFDCQKYSLNKENSSKIESAKENDRYARKINIIKSHISTMKKRQEEINKKIALLKNKEDNINRVRKENTVQKRVITSFLENQRKNLIIKRQFIENRKQIDNLAAKRTSDKIKFEKKMKYRQMKEENKKCFDNMKTATKQNNINAKNLIKQIRKLREFNKIVFPQKKVLLRKKNAFQNVAKRDVNSIKSQFLKMQIKQLENVEKEYFNRLIKSQEKFNKISAEENSFKYYMKYSKK